MRHSPPWFISIKKVVIRPIKPLKMVDGRRRLSRKDSDDPVEPDVVPTNKWLVPSKRRKPRNVLTRMRDEYKSGALATLRRCVEDRIKIKVWTRNYRFVRGICVGYLVAFDKHWNLAMTDVDEARSNPVPPPSTAVKKTRVRRKKLERNSDVPVDIDVPSAAGDVPNPTNPMFHRPDQNVPRTPHQLPAATAGQRHSPRASREDPLPQRRVAGRTSEEELSVKRGGQTAWSPSLPRTEHHRRTSSGTSRNTRHLEYSSSAGRSDFETHSEQTYSSQSSSSRDEGSSRRVEGHEEWADESDRLGHHQKVVDRYDRLHRRCFSSKGEDRSRDRRRVRDESSERSRREWSGESLDEDFKEPTSRTDRRRLRDDSFESSDKDRTSSAVERSKTRVTDRLGRLSVTSADAEVKDESAEAKVKDSEGGETEYQAVLTRHINQIFIRGDNVTLVAVLN